MRNNSDEVCPKKRASSSESVFQKTGTDSAYEIDEAYADWLGRLLGTAGVRCGLC